MVLPPSFDQIETGVLHFINQVIESNFDYQQLQHTKIPPDALTKDKQCLFTLKELHSWIFDDNSLQFADFKRFLYQSTLNQQLQEKGIEIGIEDNQGKIDRTRYALRRI